MDLAILNPKHENVLAPENRVAMLVGFPLPCVMLTVQLHNESCCRTVEVQDETRHYMLPAKVTSGDLIPPQMAPEDSFLRG